MIPVADGDGGETLGEAAMWKESLARVIPAIVVVRVCSTGAFDGEGAGYSKATGFVVDKARGIILTNRHVVTPGRYCCQLPSIFIGQTSPSCKSAPKTHTQRRRSTITAPCTWGGFGGF